LAPTETFVLTEIIGIKNLLALTNCWHKQNTCVESTKYSRRQNTSVNKILASTKYLPQQNPRVDKILASTKCWRRRRSISLLFGSAESTAADFSQTSLMFSYFSLKMLISPHAVTKCAVGAQRPGLYGCTAPRTVPPGCTGPPCKIRHKYSRRQNIRGHRYFTTFRQTTVARISAPRLPIKKP
jgi:hypothetical protein